MEYSSGTVDNIAEILTRCGMRPNESLTIPAKPPTHLAIPDGLSPNLVTHIAAVLGGTDRLYSHQARAIQAVISGEDVCLATPTASGKSLVFMTGAVEMILRDPKSRILALYPAKALIQDQLEKWNSFAGPFGIKVGFFDGSVTSPATRLDILARCQVVAMTPDVAHAWLMSNLDKREVGGFLKGLKLLVLDEAHVYEGAFGTNMAYFLRRLDTAAGRYGLICSTATVGDASSFMQQLTGRQVRLFDETDDGSQTFEKTLLLASVPEQKGFDQTVRLLGELSEAKCGRFLAFGDSRKAVERIVAAVLREARKGKSEAGEEDDDDTGEDLKDWPKLEQVLPFRAGYEADDRKAIQVALTQGQLAGVVSTSAMELGLDIGDLDIVLLLNTPPSAKAFRQRIGRAGRHGASVCVLLDDQGFMAPLHDYVERSPEPSWLYLGNRYIQYSNALCATAELQVRGIHSAPETLTVGLPEQYKRFVENELSPTEAVPQDLYSLKQQAQGNPHYEFPIRSAAEQNFEVQGPFGLKLGNLSYAQALREAYPGAVYYYMARPFRVTALEFKKGTIKAMRSRYFTTRPITDNKAFPDFKTGVLAMWKSDSGFMAEVELQVSERVRGFSQQRGQVKDIHEYGPNSEFSQKPLNRFFQTTGVCWAFPNEFAKPELVAQKLLRAFSFTCGVLERDLGVASFHSNEGPFDANAVHGATIFDSTNGSLRLTERLAVEFVSVLDCAIDQARTEPTLQRELLKLKALCAELVPVGSTNPSEPTATEGDWIRVITDNQPAIYLHTDGAVDVTVAGHRYTPHGIMYELKPLKTAGFHKEILAVAPNSQMKWMVLASAVQPINGTTRFIRVNLVTGEQEEGATASA